MHKEYNLIEYINDSLHGSPFYDVLINSSKKKIFLFLLILKFKDIALIAKLDRAFFYFIFNLFAHILVVIVTIQQGLIQGDIPSLVLAKC